MTLWNDEHLEDVHDLAMGLRRQREEDVAESVGELRESVYELRTGHRATLEVTEDELAFLIEAVGETPVDDPRPEGHRVFEKLKQLQALEQGPGGKFCDPT